MTPDILKQLAIRLQLAEAKMSEAGNIVAALEEAGEDTAEVRASLIQTQSQLDRWRATLQVRGLWPAE